MHFFLLSKVGRHVFTDESTHFPGQRDKSNPESFIPWETLWNVFQVVLYKITMQFWASSYSSKYWSFPGITTSYLDDDIIFPGEPRAPQPLHGHAWAHWKEQWVAVLMNSSLPSRKENLNANKDLLTYMFISHFEMSENKSISFNLINTTENFQS